jgi:hypothetical protein
MKQEKIFMRKMYKEAAAIFEIATYKESKNYLLDILFRKLFVFW